MAYPGNTHQFAATDALPFHGSRPCAPADQETHMSRPFADVIRDLAGGMVYENLTTQLGEVVSAVIETGKVGEISLKLSVKPNSEGSVLVTAAVKQKLPEPALGSTLFFATTTGSLVRNDPRHMDMNLREVPAQDRPLKDAVNG